MIRILSIALVLAGSLGAQTLNDTFVQMDKSASQLKSVIASMNRDVHTAIIDDDEIDNGTLRMKRDKSHGVLMVIELTGKAAKTVALDESEVVLYTPKINSAQGYKIGGKRDMVEQFLLLGFGATSKELQQSYNVSWVGAETVAGQPTGHIKLVPKVPDASRQMSGAELWISENSGLPVQQKILISNGDYWIVKYSDIKVNPQVSDETFRLKLPKGVKIEHPQL